MASLSKTQLLITTFSEQIIGRNCTENCTPGDTIDVNSALLPKQVSWSTESRQFLLYNCLVTTPHVYMRYTRYRNEWDSEKKNFILQEDFMKLHAAQSYVPSLCQIQILESEPSFPWRVPEVSLTRWRTWKVWKRTLAKRAQEENSHVVNIRLKLGRDERLLREWDSRCQLLTLILIDKTSKNEELQIRFHLTWTGIWPQNWRVEWSSPG